MFLIVMASLLISNSFSQENEVKSGEQKIIYKYKQYEKFDFDDISVEAVSGSPGDLSIHQRYQRKFSNKLPLRKNFNPEMANLILRIK
jgi:hypothetical protein